jgi:hypothetical protein
MGRGLIGRWPFLMAAGMGAACIGAAATAPEYQIKAAFLYKFATYVRWPASSTAATAAPFVIGVIGRDPFGSALGDVVRNQQVQGRGIRIRRLRRTEEALECDLVFVGDSEQPNLGRLFALLRGAPVLTVGDMDRFAEQGGMIGLVTSEDHHIRFDINSGAIERAGLKASAQLLQLGRIVGQPPEGSHH